MDASSLRSYSPYLVVGLGVLLLAFGVLHHLREMTTASTMLGPGLAFGLNAVLALCLVYAGYWLGRTDLEPSYRWVVAVWTSTGLVLFVTAITLTMVIRLFEGRSLSEPVFTLLVVASTGGIAGFVAGYYRARAVLDTQRARQATSALAFVNGVIRHDLRNDMQVIRTHASLLAERDDEEVRQRAETIAERTTKATDRIENTGAITKTMTGDADFHRLDLTSVVADSVDKLQSTYDVTVTTEMPQSAHVRANAAVESVVDNLLENAVEHNDSDDPRVDVTVETAGDSVRLVVADNGPGLPDTDGRSVFESPDGSPGGLRIIRTLVDQFGGSVGATNGDGEGAEFTVVLPRASWD